MKKLLVSIFLLFFMFGCEKPIQWEIIKSGEVENVLYVQGNIATLSKTIIYFTDKTTYILYGDYQIPYKKIIIKKAQNSSIYGDKIEELPTN